MLRLICAAVILGVGVPAWAHPTTDERRAAIDHRLVLAPSDPQAYLRRATELLGEGDTAAALDALATAQKFGAEAGACELLRARIALAAGSPAEAQSAAERALHAGAGADAHRLRARALDALGRHADAAGAFVAAIGDARVPGPDDYLDAARAFHAGGDPATALVVLDAGLGRLGPLAALQQFAIDLEVERRHYPAALARLDVLLTRNPRNRHWQQRRHEILSMSHDRHDMSPPGGS
jgi:tetratricopeptide (TPR) repeat protein